MAPGRLHPCRRAGRRPGRRIRRADNAMVHRLRLRADGVFGDRRHPRLRQFAREHRAARRGRAAADRAQQRGARHGDHEFGRYGDVRAGLGPRRRRAFAGAACRLGEGRRLCLSQSQTVGFRSHRPRRGRARATDGLDAYVFTERGVYRTGETVHVTTLAAERRRRGRARREPHFGDGAAGRHRIPARRGSRRRAWRPRARRAPHRLGADRHMARRGLFRSETGRTSARRAFSSRITCRRGSSST